MAAVKDIWHSERGIIAIALIVASAVLAIIGTITGEAWLDYSKWIFLGYAGSKGISSATEAITKKVTKKDGGS